MSNKQYNNHYNNEKREITIFSMWNISPIVFVALYIIVFLICTVSFQLLKDKPAWEDGSPIDIMTGSLIWICSSASLIMAILTRDQAFRSLIWFGGSAALGIVALDEFFAQHERLRQFTDDDYPKIAMALIAAFALFVLIKVERLRGLILSLLISGYVIHVLYLLSDLGDGDFFDIPYVELPTLRLIEEGLEVTAMSFYTGAFFLILIGEASKRRA